MPSLSDIPLQLINQPDKLAFLRWLSPIPVDFNHKRTLANLWKAATRITLTKTDWQIIQISSLTAKVPNGQTIPTST